MSNLLENSAIIQQKIEFVYTFIKKCAKIVKIYKEKEDSQMIEKTMRIGDILEANPEKAEILLDAGMHCLGCPASQAETLEEACDVHGIDVDELVKKLNS